MLVRGIVAGKTQSEAYIEAYDTKGNIATVRPAASRTARKPHVKAAIEEEMERQGLTMAKIIEPVAKALESKLKIQTADGEIIRTDEPDLEMQLKGHDRAVRLIALAERSNEASTVYNFTQINNQMKDRYN